MVEQARRIERLYLASTRSLVEALEARDPHTRGHSDRVTKYSVAVGQALAEIDLDQLTVGAQLHDIGKIGTREHVLNKPGPLTNEEREHIRQHPMMGVRILSPIVNEPAIIGIVRNHHERWDGTGYPDHFAGTAIPLLARIVAVADALDAITSSRAYRPPRRWDEATDELERGSGSQFDPDIAAVARRVLRQPPADVSRS